MGCSGLVSGSHGAAHGRSGERALERFTGDCGAARVPLSVLAFDPAFLLSAFKRLFNYLIFAWPGRLRFRHPLTPSSPPFLATFPLPQAGQGRNAAVTFTTKMSRSLERWWAEEGEEGWLMPGGRRRSCRPARRVGGLAVLLGLCQPSPHLLFTSFWHQQHVYAPTRGLERSDGGLLFPCRNILETCLAFLNLFSVEEVVATTGQGEQKTYRY